MLCSNNDFSVPMCGSFAAKKLCLLINPLKIEVGIDEYINMFGCRNTIVSLRILLCRSKNYAIVERR